MGLGWQANEINRGANRFWALRGAAANAEQGIPRCALMCCYRVYLQPHKV